MKKEKRLRKRKTKCKRKEKDLNATKGTGVHWLKGDVSWEKVRIGLLRRIYITVNYIYLHVEVLQIAIRNKIDIDKEFRKHLKETRKRYLR